MPELQWEGKRDAVNVAKNIPAHLLEFDSASSFGDAENLIVQGDNLLVMKALLPRYKNRVRCIYIDPPYNTHSAFEHYNDNFEHSAWLNLMYPRLELLREFLSDDGAIFISIDDGEVHYLKVICDEIFGRKNFVAQLVWEKKKKGAFLSKTVTNVKEYILVYCQAMDSFGGLIGEVNRSPETYPCVKTTNPRGVRIIPREIPSRFKEKNYRIAANTRAGDGNLEMIFLDEAIIENGILQNNPRVESNWIYQQSLLDEYASRGELFITSGLNLRRMVSTPRIKMLKDLLLRVGNDGKSESVFTYDENLNHGGWGTNEDANEELHKIFGKQYVFEFSKPSRLIAKLIQSITDKNSIVLDAFAGSGTTAHAVINLNASDGGERKFILIEEKEYCKTITAERVKRVGGNFKFARLGEKLFTTDGTINPRVTAEDLAAHIWFTRTGTALAENFSLPLIGIHTGSAIYLLENILTREIFNELPIFDGQKIIYGVACRLSEDFLHDNKIIFKHLPKKI
ncbi:MAG: site-specific DNA-methyltransferase [Selenomonadaceae bacterium]|nr:site-specific DNA-methyltransferase [Selenomonadaceae bacterium]